MNVLPTNIILNDGECRLMAKTLGCEPIEAGSKPVIRPISKERREYLRKHSSARYYANKDYYKQKKNEKISEIRKYILKYLLENPCVDCGEKDPIVLEFDHRERSTKIFCIGEFPRRCRSLPRVIDEISKCDIRCANCHKRRTYKQLGGKHKDIILA